MSDFRDGDIVELTERCEGWEPFGCTYFVAQPGARGELDGPVWHDPRTDKPFYDVCVLGSDGETLLYVALAPVSALRLVRRAA